MNATAALVAKLFSESFSSQPAYFFSPGRINLIGEHVDYNDGFVMPAAINKGIYYAVAPNGTEGIHFYSVDYDEWFSVELKEIKKMNGWKNYVLGVVNEFVLLGKMIGGFDCVFGGNIPRGSGMSSSAAVEGGLAFALNEIFACGLGRKELAQLCQRAEHGYPGVQCGIMDQFANMMGKKEQVLLLDCRDLSVQYFPLHLQGYRIVLINSMVHHALAAGEYNARRKQCEKGLVVLGSDSAVCSFRDIEKWEDLLAYKDRMGEQAFDCCLYVVQEIDRTRKAAELLQQNKLVGFGKLMYDTHEGLCKLYRVSCPELDFLVEQAVQDDAVIGARMMGGGFGGCTINIVKEDGLEGFIRNAGAAYSEKFNITPEAYVVETSDGTGEFMVDVSTRA
jgi:galactokinase